MTRVHGRLLAMTGALVLLTSTSLQAAVVPHPQADAQALDLAEKAISLRSAAGPGNQTPQVAELYKAALVKGGFAPSDATITPSVDYYLSLVPLLSK